MSKILSILILLALIVSMSACSDNSQLTEAESGIGSSSNNQSAETSSELNDSISLTEDSVQTQSENPDMPTRVIESGTKIIMHFDDTIIPGILNDCDTAKALIEMLPYTVQMSGYSDDFCGIMPDKLPYHEDEIHNGWLNGDIDYSVVAPYFTILHSNEENSQQYSNRVNIGVITCELSRIRNLSGSYDVLIELAE